MALSRHGLVCLIVATVLAVGCTGPSERELVALGRTQIEKQEFRTAIVQIKSGLQTYPSSAELRFLLGDSLLKNGDPAAAAVELEKARELGYDDEEIVPRLARSLLAINQPKKVTDAYSRTMLKDSAAAADLKATVAAAFGAQGLGERAEAAMNSALQLDPKNTTARLLQAQLVARRGDVGEALSLVDGIMRDDPRRREASFLQGELLRWGQNDLGGAVKAYRQALGVDPRYTQAHLAFNAVLLQQRDIPALREHLKELKSVLPAHGMTLYFETQLAFIDHDYKRAREGAQQLLKRSPENFRVLELAGLIELEGGSPRLAETYLTKVLQASPSMAPARRLLAEAYLRAGQPARAISTLDVLLREPQPSAQTLALAAEANLQTGDHAKAQSLFEQAAKSNPTDPKVLTALALTRIARGDSDAGFSQLERVASVDQSNYADLALISARLRRGDLDNALKAADNLRRKAADKTLSHHLYGQILVGKGDRTLARQSFERAVAIDSAYFPSIGALAALDLADKRADLARGRFDTVLARDPKNYHALIAAADIRRRTGGTPAEVGELLRQAVRFNPSEVEPRLLLTEHHLGQGEVKLALAAAQEAITAAPGDRRTLEILGRTQLRAGEVQQAIASFNKLVATSSGQPQPLLALAEAYLRAKDYSSATVSLRRALEISPNLLVAHKGLIRIALADNHVQEALDVAKAIQRRRPAEPAGYLLESEIHFVRQRWPEAIRALHAALDRKRSSDTAVQLHTTYVAAGDDAGAERFAVGWLKERPRDATFLFHMGSMAMDARDFQLAESRFRGVLAILPDQAMALNNVAWILLQQNKPGALGLAERANRFLPDRASVMDTLAAALAADGQLKSALEWQRRAVQREPDVAGYRLGLARLLIKSGDRPAANVELKALQKLGDNFAQQAEVTELLRTL